VPSELVQRAHDSILATHRQAPKRRPSFRLVGILLTSEQQRNSAESLAEALREKGFRIQVIRPVHETPLCRT